MKFNMKRSIYLIVSLVTAGCMSLQLSSCKKDEDDAPTASFTHTADGLMVTFEFTGSDADTYSWSFGDGETSTNENPVHTYAAAGTYTVTLTVVNPEGDDTATETVEVEGTGSSASADAPSLSLGGDGAFYAINTKTVTEAGGVSVTVKVGTATAWFQDGGNFVDVGKVKWKQGSTTEELDFNASANTYSWVETSVPTQGFAGNGISWSIEGGNGFPSVNGLSNLYPFPSTKEISESSSTISGSAAYTLSHNGSINNADSSYFAIHGPDATVIKRMGGTATEATLSAAEMASLGKGSAILQIASFKIQTDASTGKTFHMVNETVASKVVTIE